MQSNSNGPKRKDNLRCYSVGKFHFDFGLAQKKNVGRITTSAKPEGLHRSGLEGFQWDLPVRRQMHYLRRRKPMRVNGRGGGIRTPPSAPKVHVPSCAGMDSNTGASAVPDVNPGTSLDKRNEGNPAYRSAEAQMPIGDASAGSRTFSTNCAGCHGLDGRGRTGASGRSARSAWGAFGVLGTQLCRRTTRRGFRARNARTP